MTARLFIASLFALLALPSLSGAPLPAECRIPIDGRADFELPDPAGAAPRYLAFSARIDTPNHRSGAQPALEIMVNDLPLNSMRLANKGDYFHFRTDRPVPWFRGGPAMTLGYYPWDGVSRTIDKQFIHDFVFELDGLWKSSGNQLSFVNIFKAFKDSAIEIRNLRLLSADDFPRSPTIGEKAPASRGADRLRRRAWSLHRGLEKRFESVDDFVAAPDSELRQPREYRLGDCRVTEGENGVLLLEFQQRKHRIDSSWTAGGRTVTLSGGKARTAELEITRAVERGEYAIIVRDTLTNLTDRDLPVIVDNAVKTELDALRSFRLAGAQQRNFAANTGNLVTRDYAMTPLLFFGYADTGLGVYLEDDCYRNQYSAIAVDDTLHLVDDLFYLAPKRTYTFVWRLYPVAGGDYYTLVNAIRHDYALFQPIPGLFGFMYPDKENGYYERYYRKKLDTPELLRQFFDDSGITIPCVSPVLDDARRPGGTSYGSEPADVYRDSLAVPGRLLKFMRESGIELPLLLYTDVHLVRTDGDFDVGRRSKWQERLADSVLLNSFNQPAPYRSGYLYHVAPRPDNRAGRQVAENLRTVFDEFNFSGVFLDEWNQSSARVAYPYRDGSSALLNSEGGIDRKIAIVPLYSKEFLLETGRRVTAGGRIAFANQFDALVELMQLPIIHFAEPVAQQDCYLIRAAQLSRTPLTLTCKRGTTAWSDVKYFLRYGIICCYYATRLYGDHVLKKVYPITVREIHPGVVIGEDRIVTNRSGRFTLDGKRKLTAYIYSDPQGLLKNTVEGGAEIKLQLDPDREVAVIVAE